jgi:hypothetical protein
MASQLQLRRGTTIQHGPFIGAPGEVTVDTDKKTTVVHDGTTAGGFPLLSASGGTMTGPVSMGGSKITDLATPTVLTDAASKGYIDGLIAAATIADDDYGDVTVSSGATVWTVNNGVIADANIASGAAVALNKLATGALPTGITVASANLVNGTIVDADINAAAGIAGSKLASDSITNTQIKSDAAIAGTKIAPNFGSQDVQTTGQAAVGTAINANVKLNVGGTMPAQTTQRALAIAPAFDNNASVGAQAVITGPSTAANGGAAYTVPSLTHFYANQGTLHADSTVTNQYGLFVASNLTGATNNYGVFSQIPGGASRWNVYASGTAANYFAGSVSVGSLSFSATGGVQMIPNNSEGALSAIWNRVNSANPSIVLQFRSNGSAAGAITHTNTTTNYGTSSDYRLKENPTPVTGALDTVAALKPVDFAWKSDGSAGRGFIAHELQAVVPEAVTGEKDAVDAEGNPEYQGVDASKLVPLLVAAVQELSAKVAALEATR